MPLLFPDVDQILDVSIFARHSRPGWQSLVMDVTIAAPHGAWLILPIPTATDASTGGGPPVRLLELDAYPDLLADVGGAFEIDHESQHSAAALELLGILGSSRHGRSNATLVDDRLGLEGLDEPGRPPEVFWDSFPEYADHQFAVVHLEPAGLVGDLIGRPTRYRGIGVEFRSREPAGVFFPARQQRHGAAPEKARYAHSLYFQTGRPLQGWQSSGKPARQFVDVDRAAGVVDPDAPVHWVPVFGELNNIDLWMRPSDLWPDGNDEDPTAL